MAQCSSEDLPVFGKSLFYSSQTACLDTMVEGDEIEKQDENEASL
jgi:hypothetical protein